MKRVFIAFGILCLAGSAIAQDIHFSQFYHTPVLINPALAGAFAGDHRIIVNFKDQWGALGPASGGPAYRTSNVSYDMKLFKKKWPNSYLGLGFDLFSDKAGDSKMGTNQFSTSVSSILSLNDNHRLTLGLQGGFVQRSIDINNPDLRWDSQFNGESYDPTLPSGEIGNFESFNYADFGTGLSWSYGTDEANMISNDQFRCNAGVALYHVNRPKFEYYNLQDDKLYSKVVVHGGMYIGLKNSVGAIIPQAFYMRQGPNQEINFGGMFRYMVKEESKVTGFIKEMAILFGGYYRVGDAFIPAVTFEYANFALGVNYDINTSGLKAATNSQGGIELSLKFVTPSPFKTGSSSKSRFL